LAALVLGACSSAPESDKAQVGEKKEEKAISEGAHTLQVDTDQSIVEWVGTKTTGRHHGSINIQSGQLALENGEIAGGKFIMDITSLTVLDEGMDDEDRQKLTGHLKSGDFFKAEEYPTARFVITSAERTKSQTIKEENDPKQEDISAYKISRPTHTITGNLTMRDSTKSISFPAKVTIDNGKITGKAKFNINRKEWGMKWEYPPGEVVLNNTVHLGIKLVATDGQMAEK
jgi:polyisoprenoid-binding protein YceI